MILSSSLHTHSYFSILDGFSSPEENLKRASELGLKALAITEHGELTSHPYYAELKNKYPDIKQLFGCCLPGQLIYTENGVVPIEDIATGTKVLTHTGEYKNVIGTMCRNFNGTIYGFTAPRCNTVWLTGEHPVLVGELSNDGSFITSWIKAEELKSSKKQNWKRSITNWNSFVCFPRKNNTTTKSIHLIDFLDSDRYEVKEDGLIYKKKTKKFEHEYCTNITNTLQLTPQFMRMIGHYISEGCVPTAHYTDKSEANYLVNFTFGTELKLDRIKQTIDDIEFVCGKRPTVSRRDDKHTHEIAISNVTWANIIKNMCGKGCDNKVIPSFVYYADDECVSNFIHGVFSDAKITEKAIVLKMTSKNVVWGVRLLLARFGKLSKVSYKNYDSEHKPCYMMTTTPLEWKPDKQKQQKYLLDDNYIYLPLTHVDQRVYNGPVYNLHVEDNNSYVTDFVVHNCELYECEDRDIKDPNNKYYHMILIARNEEGRRAINRISTLGHLHGFYYKPRVTRYDIAKEGAENLIILSACLISRLSRTDDYNTCLEMVQEYKSLFPYYFLEIQAHDNEEQQAYNQKIMRLAADTNTPVVVTNDVHAATKEDLYYQDYFLRIAQDKETAAEIYSGCYFMSDEEIHAILDKQIGYDAVCECLKNTDLVADLCEDVDMPWHEPELPKINIPNKYANSAEYLRELTWEGYARRGMDKWPQDKQENYKKRIEEELYVIEKKDFCDYFLILVDYINWCRNNNVIVGPGRGSACGSEVCYLLGITNLDSIKYDLDFGRFLTIERKDLPDVDVDVSDRAKVIDYLTKKYGEDRVVQVMNIVYTSPITSIKDIGKLLGFPYKEMERISKGFVQDTWEECLKNNKEVADNPKYKELLDIASHITNRPRGYGIHAGGVIVCRNSYDHYIGIRRGQNGEHVISVDKVMDERISLVKYDCLGVASLVAINEAMQEDNIDPWEIDINNPEFEHDEAIFDLICSGKTDSLFQIESQGMKDLIARLQPRSLEEVTALVALYRPDAMPAIDGYVECKRDPTRIKYIHPDMAQIMGVTFGQNIYQEQSMRLTKVFGGRSDAGADRMRKCLAKKKPEKVKEEVGLLHQEILSNGYSKEVADKICEELSTKGGYGFNKSHAAAYGVICMQTAYLKAHHKTAFFKAMLNLNKDKAGKVNKIIIDAKQFDVSVLPPNINNSEMNFSITNDQILFGLSAISGIGSTLAESIINERNLNGKFKNFNDFLERVCPTKAQVVNLVKSGAIPTKNKKKFLINYFKSQFERKEYKPVVSYGTKANLLLNWNIDTNDYMIGKKIDKETILRVYNEKRKEKFESEQKEKYQAYIDECSERYLQDEVFWEFETLQIFLNDENPFAKAYEILDDFSSYNNGDKCVIVGIISKIQKKKTKKGQQFAFANIYSGDGLIEVTIWPDALQKFQNLIVKGQQVAILGKKEGEDKMIVDKLKPYDQWLKDVTKKRYIKF